MKKEWLPVLITMGRILTFRASPEDFTNFNGRHLGFGLLCTWLVGIGRTWDNPGAELLQRSGIGSVVYVFVLSAILWSVLKSYITPITSYRHMLTFVCLVSPPGFLYAIPVEKILDAGTAVAVNYVFLAIVAIWRVALLTTYFRKAEGLLKKEVAVITLLPLAVIMMVLTPFSFASIVFRGMAGVHQQTAAQKNLDAAFDLTLLGLTLISWVAFFFLINAYHGMRTIRAQSSAARVPRKAVYENPKTGDW